MIETLSLLGVMMFISFVLAALAHLYTLLDRRVRYWASFWAALLLVCAAIPIFAVVLYFFQPIVPTVPIIHFIAGGALENFTWDNITTTTHSVSGMKRLSYFAPILILVYLAGVVLNLIRLFLGRIRAVQLTQKGTVQTSTSGINFHITSASVSPMAYTPLCTNKGQKIIMPERFLHFLSTAEVDNILYHEQEHLNRKDDRLGLLLRLIITFFWFSPFAHYFFSQWSQSTELACDRAVTLKLSHQHRRAYAQTLLKMMTLLSVPHRPLPMAAFITPLPWPKLRNEKMRLKFIMKPPQMEFSNPPARFLLIAGALFLSLLVATPLASATKNDQRRGSKSDNPLSVMVDGRTTLPYGMVRDPSQKDAMKMHKGVDIAAPYKTPIFAPANGIVLQMGTDEAHGTYMIVQLGAGLQMNMAHLHSVLLEEGASFQRGEKIALLGNSGRSTGPHVHIEIRQNGELIDPFSVTWP